MMPALRGRVSKFIFLNTSDSVRHLYSAVPLLMRSHSFSSIDGGRPPSEVSDGTSHRPFARGTTQSAGSAINNGDGIGDADGGVVNYRHRGRQDPPDPIPNRPLRGDNSVSQPERRSQRNFDLGGKNFDDDHHSRAGGFGFEKSTAVNATRVGGNRTNRQSGGNLFKFGTDEGAEKNMKSFAGEKHGDFLEKFKLGFDKAEKPQPHSNAANPQLHKEGEEIKGDKAVPAQPSAPPQEADEIFKKMKETGLIPNAVAMLDGLCKDGLVQEAMKLFGLMREKGTIPEVVIYTAVVEGFCKAQKLEDAKRIFRKMQNNGISPNAFSYAVLIQGLYKGRKLEDALEFCVEMLEAGHSPNLATFVGLVDGFCREKGLEEARSIIVTLREKGYFFDEKAAREYLDKKGPFLPLVWEAILGKKSSQRSF